MRSSLKTVVFWALTCFIIFTVLDIASYILVRHTVPARIAARVGCGNLDFHLANRRRLQAYYPDHILGAGGMDASAMANSVEFKMFHPILGWDYPPDASYRGVDKIDYHHGPDGERRTCASYPTTLISTYGDSFTYCADVKDEETWQTFLARKLRSSVLNFGVGGYGTDQAVLKYELQDRCNTKIVMLCIWPENINRIVNIYRPFYSYNDPLNLTKPRVIKTAKGCALISNPVKTRDGIMKLDDPEFLAELANLDYWYQYDKRLPPFSFPWTLTLFRWRDIVIKQLKLASPRFLRRHMALSYPANLFDEDEPFACMRHVVDRFVATARGRGSVPIVVITPNKDFVQEFMDHGTTRASKLIDYLSSQEYPFLDGIRAMADMNPTGAQLNVWYRDHATATGNQVLANILSRYLLDHFRALVAPGLRESGTGGATSELWTLRHPAAVDTVRAPVYE